MSTVTSFTGTTPAPTAAPQAPSLIERLGLKAKHAIVIGCLGFIVTVALFCVGGWLAYNNLFGVAEATTATLQHNTYQAGTPRYSGIGSENESRIPNCKAQGKRYTYPIMDRAGNIRGYFCN